MSQWEWPDVAALQHPGVTERVVSNLEWIVHRITDYYVVDQIDADDFGCLPQLACELDVGRTRRRVSAGMVVGNDDRGCGRQYRDLKHLPRMREGAGERPQRDHRPTDGLVFPLCYGWCFNEFYSS